MELTCPHCHAPVTAEVKLSTLEKAKTRLFKSTGQWIGKSADDLQQVENTYVPPPVTQAVATMPGSRDAPVRAPNLLSDVAVPLSYAAIPAFCIAILAFTGWLYAGLPKPGFTIISFFFSAALWFWLKGKDSREELLWSSEKWTGVDINKDGHIGEPDQPVVVQIWSNSGYKKRYCGLSESQVQSVAQAILGDGEKFTREELCKRRKCFPIDKYSNLIEMWIGLGMLEKKGEHDNAPVSLTDAGLSFLGQHYPPAPED